MEKNLILQRAKNAEMAHDYASAERLYKQLLDDDPSNVDYLRAMGSIFVQAGEDEKAISYYDQILAYYPHYTDAMNSLGACYRRLKRYEDSISILQRALDEDIRVINVKYNLGFTYKEMGDYEDAIDCFNAVIADNPNDVLAQNHLGTIYMTLKDYQKSIASFKRGLQTDPNHPILNYNLARCYEMVKNYPDAIRCYGLALKTKPGWKDAISDFSRLLMKLQQNTNAQEIVEQAVKLHPEDPDLYSLLGEVFFNQFDFESATKVYKQANSLIENNAQVKIGLASAYEKLGKPEQAATYLGEVFENDPDNFEAKKLYASVMLSSNQPDEAAAYIQNLFEDENAAKNVQLLDLYGQYYVCKKNDEKANEYFNKIRFVNHHYKDYLLNSAMRYAQLQNWEKAEELANKYVAQRPQNPDGYMALGSIYEQKGDFIGAKNFFSKSATLRKPNVYAANKITALADKLTDLDMYVDLQEIDPNEVIEEAELSPIEEVETPVTDGMEDFDFAQMGGDLKSDSELNIENPDYFETLANNVHDHFAKEEDDNEFEIQDPDKMDFADEESAFDFNEKDEDGDPLKDDEGGSFFDDDKEFSPKKALPEMAKMSEEAKDSAETARVAAENAQKLMEQLQEQQAAMQEQLAQHQTVMTEQMKKNAQNMVKEAVCDFLEMPEVEEEEIPVDLPSAEGEISMDPVSVPSELDANLQEIAMDPEPEISDEPEEPAPIALDPASVPSELETSLEDLAMEQENENAAEDLPDQDVQNVEMPDLSIPEEDFIAATSGTDIPAGEMLDKIHKILRDDKVAKQNAEKLELFKTLRILTNFIPEKDKNSFQSCRMRMMIEYIIAKLSGRPGLLKTTQSLIKSGVLGQDYEKQLSKDCEQEMSNELIRKVLVDMKKMAQSLEDEPLATSLIVTADGILEKIELINQKSEIF